MTHATVTPGAHQHSGYTTALRFLRVESVTTLSPRVKHFRLVSDDGTALASHQPGSHLIVCAGEHRNAYSLVDDGILPTSYGISVLRRDEGRGSDWMHDHLRAGDSLEIEGPRAMFAPILNQRNALLIAGGIGVTPILSHTRAIARAGRTAEVVYSYRPEHAPHLDALRELAELPGITLHEATTVEETVEVIAQRFRVQPLGTHAYACGPPPLLHTYLDTAKRAGWPTGRVHYERFSAPVQEPGKPFTVTLRRSGTTLSVPSGVSLLQRLREHGASVASLCERGVCGECRIAVVGGAVEHRDFVLSDEEKSTGEFMLCCVSRGIDLEVDL